MYTARYILLMGDDNNTLLYGSIWETLESSPFSLSLSLFFAIITNRVEVLFTPSFYMCALYNVLFQKKMGGNTPKKHTQLPNHHNGADDPIDGYKKKMKKKNLAVANSFKESFFKVLIDIFLLTGNKSLKMQWIFFFSLSSQVARW